ncbi:TIGR03986 family type III CRISPR-associated RAMP protein [Actinokineospora sp.]|uniref:TIGR03986 family type III CRISPR-associated RAMP protein n=1 Tax=Actinokineospora sp. TaxID=1872133 RepID=UPI004037CD81
MTGTDKFHNPYHFVPALDSDALDQRLGRHAPAGHDRLHHDRWTGRLAVTLTTVTPLLIPDAGTTAPNGHRTFGTRVADVDGERRVYLPPTSIKGALRSVYEAVTNSRMGVFDHPAPLGYRPDARSGLNVHPVLVRLTADGKPAAAMACLWLDYGNDSAMIKGAALPMYRGPACRYPDGTVPVHGDKASAWVELVEHLGRASYRYWRVVSIWRSGADTDQARPADLGAASRGSANHQPLGPGALLRGFVHRTNANITGKHDERLFPVECVHADPGVQTNPRTQLRMDDAGTRYRDLIADYRAQHLTERRNDISSRRKPDGSTAKPWETYQSANKTVFAWSRHLYDAPGVPGQGTDVLRPDSWVSCYALREGDLITELLPVLISRRLHANSPAELLPDGIAPAESLAELSPADRVFGWVRQSTRDDDAEDAPDTAWRGALRIGPVHGPLAADAVEHLGDGIPLEILSAPKPSQGRFYTAARDNNGVPTPLERRAGKESFFADHRVVRGRKVYPHQRAAEQVDYWNTTAQDREFRRGGDTRDDQNRTMTTWVRVEQEFTFTIDLRNVSDLELGALLWILDPDQFGRPNNPGRHRIGGGKPLGFGSVELRLAESGHDLRRGTDWCDDFRTLGQTAPDTETRWRALPATFETVLTATPAGRALCAAIRAAAVGYDDKHPVHYPRLTPSKDPNGENYRWFVENEKNRVVGGRGGKVKDAEPLPAFGTPLPLDTKPKDSGTPPGSGYRGGSGRRRT